MTMKKDAKFENKFANSNLTWTILTNFEPSTQKSKKFAN